MQTVRMLHTDFKLETYLLVPFSHVFLEVPQTCWLLQRVKTSERKRNQTIVVECMFSWFPMQAYNQYKSMGQINVNATREALHFCMLDGGSWKVCRCYSLMPSAKLH